MQNIGLHRTPALKLPELRVQVLTHVFHFQLIFRKVSDVKREKELAEKRKNDPALNQTQDHLVRKLFSKFKKGPAFGGSTDGAKDLERGDSFALTDNGILPGGSGANGKEMSGVMALTVAAAGASNGGHERGERSLKHINNNKVGASETVGSTGTTTTNLSTEMSEPIRTSPRPRKPLGGGGWARLKGGGGGGSKEKTSPQPSVDEKPSTRTPSVEEAHNNRLSPKGSEDHGDSGGKDKKAAAAEGISQQEYQKIMRNMSDFKVDMKSEISSMNKKITKMEDLMVDFIGKLNAALPAAAASGGSGGGGHRSEDEEGVTNRHHRRHGKSKNRERSRSKSSSNVKGLGDEDATGDRSPRRETMHGGSISYIPGQKEEFL